jgi:hypothetical protein
MMTPAPRARERRIANQTPITTPIAAATTTSPIDPRPASGTKPVSWRTAAVGPAAPATTDNSQTPDRDRIITQSVRGEPARGPAGWLAQRRRSPAWGIGTANDASPYTPLIAARSAGKSPADGHSRRVRPRSRTRTQGADGLHRKSASLHCRRRGRRSARAAAPHRRGALP